jgi:hypothetical protein
LAGYNIPLDFSDGLVNTFIKRRFHRFTFSENSEKILLEGLFPFSVLGPGDRSRVAGFASYDAI